MRFNLLLITILGCIFYASCKSNSESESTQLRIVATTGMIADILKNIAGEYAQVEALMGPGVDPHLYKASQGDIGKLRNADIVFYNGLHLEGKMTEIFESLGKEKPVVAVSDGIDKNKLITINQEGDKITYDPHIWFDVSLWEQATAFAMQQLIKIDPIHADSYKLNGEKFLENLRQLHAEVISTMQTIPIENRILITSHDAFSYFGRAYDVRVIGLQGISTAAEFGLKDITDMVNTIIAEKVKAVFVESSVSEKSIRSVQEGCRQKKYDIQLGGTLYSDAMGYEGTPEGTYIGMVRHNIQTMLEALK
ncbi:MAG: zinc ABC transporter substrate-binding protein [Bacteroidetes bacterium]|nr:zinc ABC transporter substrate-binding protein [Bacteroidota bacterium]